MHMSATITVITPTTGKPSLDVLISSLENQTVAAAALHILL